MPAPFAALEARVNTAVFKRLANASATLGGVAVDGIFDNAYLQDDMGGASAAASSPVFTLASSLVPANVAGMPLIVNGTTYKVVEPMPDGTGATLLRLRT